MTDLPPVQYLDEAARLMGFSSWDYRTTLGCHTRIIAHARALHENAQLRAEIAALRPRETLEQVARREALASNTSHHDGVIIYVNGFLRAAEMAKAGELPDE